MTFFQRIHRVVSRFCIVVIFVMSWQHFYAQSNYGVRTKTDYREIFFPFSSHMLGSEAVQALKVFVEDYILQNEMDSASMYIFTHASFEGNWNFNNKLSQNRLASVRNYIYYNYPVLQQYDVIVESRGEDWKGFLEMVAVDSLIPFREELLMIANNDTMEPDQKEAEIKKLGKGKTYLYLRKHIFPFQRRAVIYRVVTTRPLSEPLPPDNEPEPKSEPEPESEPAPEPESEPESESESEPIQIPTGITEPENKTDRFRAIKTNLMQLGIGIANLGVEFPIANHYSIDIPVTFSPYTISNSWRMRTLSIQPEFRWWPNEQMRGHFVGLHGQIAYYNVSWNKEDRYQDKDGKTPLWGAGISYGYAIPIKNHWGMEFTLGCGYSHLVYDIFYNVENGAKYTTETKKYWGITRAGITLIYKFNKTDK